MDWVVGDPEIHELEIRIQGPEAVAGRERKGDFGTSKLVEGQPSDHRMETTVIKVGFQYSATVVFVGTNNVKQRRIRRGVEVQNGRNQSCSQETAELLVTDRLIDSSGVRKRSRDLKEASPSEHRGVLWSWCVVEMNHQKP